MVKEAEIIEQQSLARAAPVQSAQPSDYSAQWAEYYRSVGKVKEAEAIEEQMRSKVCGLALHSLSSVPLDSSSMVVGSMDSINTNRLLGTF